MTAPATAPTAAHAPTPPPARPRRRSGLARAVDDLLLGARLSVGGGRNGWVRLAMIAVGVGLGVTMLLLAATLPPVLGARDARVAARAVEAPQDQLEPGAGTLLTDVVRSAYRNVAVEGRLVQPEGDRAPVPPGVTALPGPGEIVVSPALGALLESEDGAALRGRWGDEVVGTIGPEGLAGPEELTFYLGTDELTDDRATRIDAFGTAGGASADEASPMLVVLAVVALAALLVPVAIFVTTAVRFGGEARDRRLAALRLVGADAVMTRRIAAGETLAGALLGLVVGRLLYLVAIKAVRELVPGEMSFFAADGRPMPLLVGLIVVVVPTAAVLATMSAMRRVVAEPLGVVRRGDVTRRRLWWRLVLPVAGLAMLFPLLTGGPDVALGTQVMVMAGVVLLLVGVALLLPWLVEATVRRLQGGPVAWELAVRRLQLDSGTAVRSVSAIAVSVAGLIAVQGMVAAVEAAFADQRGRSPDVFQAEIYGAERDDRWAALAGAPGIEDVRVSEYVRAVPLGGRGSDVLVTVGDCVVLAQQAQLEACVDGDVFVVEALGSADAPLGATFTLGDPAEGPAPRWTLPDDATLVRPVATDAPAGMVDVLVTPSVLEDLPVRPGGIELHVALDPAEPDAVDLLRTAAAQVDPRAYVAPIENERVAAVLLGVRQALLVGTVALLALVGASMLVNVVEQLRERRRLLAALLAFGTRRSTLGASILFQVAVPVLLGLALAVVTGTGLSAVLLAGVGEPPTFDWLGIGTTTAVAALVVLLTTAATLPVLWRLARPTGLRSE